MRSIVGLCEQSGYRSAAQKEPIRTIFTIFYDFLIVLSLNLKVSLWMCTYRTNLRSLLTNYDVTAV